MKPLNLIASGQVIRQMTIDRMQLGHQSKHNQSDIQFFDSNVDGKQIMPK